MKDGQVVTETIHNVGEFPLPSQMKVENWITNLSTMDEGMRAEMKPPVEGPAMHRLNEAALKVRQAVEQLKGIKF